MEDEAAFKGLGVAIKELREAGRLPRATVAEAAGVDEATLRQIEEGMIEARWGTLRKIAYALEVPLATLLAEGERHEPPRPGETEQPSD